MSERCFNLPPRELYDFLHLCEEKGIDIPKSIGRWWEKETILMEKEKVDETRKTYWVHDDGEHCPICKADLAYCQLGPYCSNDKCEGQWVDGIAHLTPEQAEKFKDIIIGSRRLGPSK